MKKAQAFLVTKSYTDYKFSELLFVGAIMFFRNAPGRFYFAFLHSFTSFLGINNSYAYKYYWITFNFISLLFRHFGNRNSNNNINEILPKHIRICFYKLQIL